MTRDTVQVELRHQHIGAVSARLSALTEEFRTKHQAASYRGAGASNAMDMRNMRNLVQSLPQYRCAARPRCTASLHVSSTRAAPYF